MTTDEADVLQSALELAVEAHRGQYRKYTGEPYVIHPIRVMLALADQPLAVQVAAVLHDTVEDTTVSLAMIEAMFGQEVERLVDALTRREDEKYADFIDRIISTGRDAILIKLADVGDNMRNGTEGRRDRYSNSALRLMDALRVVDHEAWLRFMAPSYHARINGAGSATGEATALAVTAAEPKESDG